jgi:hypothetical protein
MKNYRLSLKRTEMVNSGAYDGRFREKIARNKYSFNLLKNQ